jgi:hypothetical protein
MFQSSIGFGGIKMADAKFLVNFIDSKQIYTGLLPANHTFAGIRCESSLGVSYILRYKP